MSNLINIGKRNAEGYCRKCGAPLDISGQCVSCAVNEMPRTFEAEINTLPIHHIQDALRMLEAPRVTIDFIVIHPHDTLQVFRSLRRGGFTLTRQGRNKRVYTVTDKEMYIAEIYIPLPELASAMERGKFIRIPRAALKWPKVKPSGGFS